MKMLFTGGYVVLNAALFGHEDKRAEIELEVLQLC